MNPKKKISVSKYWSTNIFTLNIKSVILNKIFDIFGLLA